MTNDKTFAEVDDQGVVTITDESGSMLETFKRLRKLGNDKLNTGVTRHSDVIKPIEHGPNKLDPGTPQAKTMLVAFITSECDEKDSSTSALESWSDDRSDAPWHVSVDDDDMFETIEGQVGPPLLPGAKQ